MMAGLHQISDFFNSVLFRHRRAKLARVPLLFDVHWLQLFHEAWFLVHIQALVELVVEWRKFLLALLNLHLESMFFTEIKVESILELFKEVILRTIHLVEIFERDVPDPHDIWQLELLDVLVASHDCLQQHLLVQLTCHLCLPELRLDVVAYRVY